MIDIFEGKGFVGVVMQKIKSIITCMLFSLCFCQTLYSDESTAERSSLQLPVVIPAMELGFLASRLDNFQQWLDPQIMRNNRHRHDQESNLKKFALASGKFLIHPETCSIFSAYLYSLPSNNAKTCAWWLASIPSMVVAAKISTKLAACAWHPIATYDNAMDRIGHWWNTLNQMNAQETKSYFRKLTTYVTIFFNDYALSKGLCDNFWYNANFINFCDSPDQHHLPSLASYNPDYATMAQQLGLNPQTIYVDSHEGSGPASMSGYHSHVLMLGGMQQFLPGEQRAIVGHELIHLQEQAPLKAFFAMGLAYLSVRAGIKACNWLTKEAKRRYGEDRNSWPARILRAMNAITHTAHCAPFISPLTQSLLCRVTLKYYNRPFEKSADIKSAKQFGTAQELINVFKMVKESREKYKKSLLDGITDGDEEESKRATIELLRYYIAMMFDEHPSEEDRINYLTPIAQEQEKPCSGDTIICNSNIQEGPVASPAQ